MSLPRLALAVIGDEIGPSLDEMISFCHEHEVRRLDMRTVGGRNLLSMTLDEVSGIARTIEKAGLQVPTFVSPLLKWPADGKGAEGGTVDFAFDPADCPGEDPLVHAFDLAIMMGAGRIRVFSHLHYPGYRPQDLFGRYERLLDLALTYSVTVEVENEPVCNIATVTDLAELFDSMAEAMAPNPLPPTFRPLIDIGNAWAAGNHRAMPRSRHSRRAPTSSISRTAIRQPSAPCRWATATFPGLANSNACLRRPPRVLSARSSPASRRIARRMVATRPLARSPACAESPARSASRSSKPASR
jgi:hypothetical protein